MRDLRSRFGMRLAGQLPLCHSPDESVQRRDFGECSLLLLHESTTDVPGIGQETQSIDQGLQNVSGRQEKFLAQESNATHVARLQKPLYPCSLPQIYSDRRSKTGIPPNLEHERGPTYRWTFHSRSPSCSWSCARLSVYSIARLNTT